MTDLEIYDFFRSIPMASLNYHKICYSFICSYFYSSLDCNLTGKSGLSTNNDNVRLIYYYFQINFIQLYSLFVSAGLLEKLLIC